MLPAPAQGGLAADPLAARLSECGTMNMFFVFKLPKGGVELATPRLDDTLLPGVTRDSVLRIAGTLRVICASVSSASKPRVDLRLVHSKRY